MEDKNTNISDELLAAFLDGNVNRFEANDVLSSINQDNEILKILSLSDVIDAECEKEERRIIPMSSLAASNSRNLCSFECEIFILTHLDYDIDNWSLLETAKANSWLKEDGTPLHHVGRLLELKGLSVARKYDCKIEDLQKALDDGKQVIAVIDKNILEGKYHEREKNYHAIYITGVENNDVVVYLDLETLMEENIEGKVFHSAWSGSSNYMVTAEEGSGRYNPQPINVDSINLDTDLKDLTEAIAENAHDIWARARMNEGWTYGTKRDDIKKQHPDLVPYAQLPETEKEYDRLMAMNTLRLVRRLGYDIVKDKNDQ